MIGKILGILLFILFVMMVISVFVVAFKESYDENSGSLFDKFLHFK